MNNNLKNKPIAIVLGGTFPHITLINNLQQRGYYTILVDYNKYPPAKDAADEHIQESTLDKEKVLEIARERGVKLVISACIDQANVTACYVAEKLGLPLPYSYETAINVTNKVLMKRRMIDYGIPTSKYYHLKDLKDYNQLELQFPVVVKPTDSNSSKGVRKASNGEEMNKFLQYAFMISRSNEAIVEEFKEGREIGADCYVQNKDTTILMTRERRKIAMNEDPIQQIQGSIWPADISKKILNDLKKIANKIAYAFNLDNTPLMIQAIVNNDEINIIEFAPRIGGGENYKIIQLHTDFDIIDAAIDSFLGLQVNLNYKLPVLYYADIYIYTRPGLFGNIANYEELIKNKVVEYLNTYKTKGVEIGSDISSNNRVGAFTVKSDKISELFEKINTSLENIEVYDTYGEPIMRKDIYY
ncbi:acetyl-CoA carboxylase biotin carboxylase subunit family protein [Bacteroidota bacterium]